MIHVTNMYLMESSVQIMSNPQNPLFSIVIANYNHGQFLEEAIQSILKQICKDYELIIVDGGSSDNSIKIIQKYKDKISWWISEKDHGQSNAFNKGFDKAKGDYFFWLNADDLLLPNSLIHAKNAIHNDPRIEWIAANTIFFSKNGEILKCSRGPSWRDFLIEEGPIYVYGPTSIFHRRIFEDVKGFDERLHYSMDTDLWLRFKNNGHRFTRIHKYFWAFRIHKESKTSHAFTSSPNSEFAEEQCFILRKNRARYSKKGSSLQFAYKIICGSMIRSCIDTLSLRGKNIFEL
jgi:glycosyltransferase involved in cell wall biosynthesis